jgi:hypothetical protein
MPSLSLRYLVADLMKGAQKSVDTVSGITVDALYSPLAEAVQHELGGVWHTRSSLLVARVRDRAQKGVFRPARVEAGVPHEKTTLFSVYVRSAHVFPPSLILCSGALCLRDSSPGRLAPCHRRLGIRKGLVKAGSH